ncbi:MAG: 50S ribosomal protein L30e [Candidatus Bathyarchaeota archaeon]|nr:50S ribosomal protein L30e [Candidatus Bathyarchaeota archaeon]
MEISRSILNAVRTGRVYIGAKSTFRSVMFRRARLVVLAENAPKSLADGITYYCKLAGIPIYIYRGSSIELGRACGKPFPVSALGIRDPGDSDVFELLGVEPR